jgi:hypothetical protein
VRGNRLRHSRVGYVSHDGNTAATSASDEFGGLFGFIEVDGEYVDAISRSEHPLAPCEASIARGKPPVMMVRLAISFNSCSLARR